MFTPRSFPKLTMEEQHFTQGSYSSRADEVDDVCQEIARSEADHSFCKALGSS